MSAAGGSAASAAHPVWLVRHAPTAWTGERWCGRSDPSLTAAGRAAAERVAAEIAAELAAELAAGLAAEVVILASPLRRARETADVIARMIGAPVHVEADLVEVDFGVADGLNWDELVAAYPHLSDAILAGGNPDWPAGETAAEVIGRARLVADRILAAAETGAVVVVSHGGLLREIASLASFGDPVSGGSFEPASARRLDRVAGRRSRRRRSNRSRSNDLA